jgi:hypothetical protein
MTGGPNPQLNQGMFSCGYGTMTFLTNGVLESLPFDDVHHLDASSSRHPSPTVIEDLVNRVRLFERKKREQDIWREVLA